MMSNSNDPKQVVARGYDQVAEAYARLEEEGAEWPRMRWLRKLLNRLEPGSSVLDLGCGSGDPADVEIAKTHQVTGVDISETQIRLAKINVPTERFIHSDLGSVAFPVESFDAVISFYTLEHLPRDEHRNVFERIAQWLKAGGYFLLCTEANESAGVQAEWLGVSMFFSFFDSETLKHLIQEVGFEILEAATETQLEGGHEVSYLWVLAQLR